MMKIAIIDVLGLFYDGSTLTKRGLGGSESAVIFISKELVKLGFDVTVYNDCETDDAKPGVYDNVLYRPLKDVENSQEYYDIAIASRSIAPFAPDEWQNNFKTFIQSMPKFETFMSKVRHKVLWMHDTFCDGDNHIEEFVLSGRIDEIFTLSDFHTAYIANADHGRRRMFEVLKKKLFITRNGIGAKSKEWIDISKKDPNLFVYNASVSKGLSTLIEDVWPKIKQKIVNAKLIVIGGYYKMPSNKESDENELKLRKLSNNQISLQNNVYFTGIIKHSEISEILSKASFTIYPSEFPETYGISTIESLAHNTPLITCEFGALEETAIDDACYKIPYPIIPNSLFPHINKEQQVNAIVELAIRAYNDPYLHQQKMYACNKIKNICSWDTVALQWKQHFYNKLGLFLSIEEYRKVNRINYEVRKVFGRTFLNREELQEPRNFQQLYIDIVTPVYNSENYIKSCILSVAQQDYENYKMYIIDDCSTDETRNVIANTINLLPENLQKKFEVIYNENNFGALFNQYNTIKQNCKGDIIMLLDGDDCLINNPNLFHKYNNLYQDGAEFTYGSCWSVVDNIPLVAQEYPPEIKKNKNYRKYKFNWNIPYTHLRTFKLSLFDNLKESNFKDAEGKWLRAGGDVALFYDLIENANPDNVICIPEIVYMYNDANPLNDYKINAQEQNKNVELIMSKNNKPNKKILIAIPTAKNIEVETFKSIYDLTIPEGYETTFQYFYGYNIDQVRNLIAQWILDGYDYLFSVDSDISFPANTLEKMISYDVDIISGVYIQRIPNSHTIEIYKENIMGGVSHIPWEDIKDKHLTEIDACGFGCVLVKSEVFHAMKYPHFEYHSALDHQNTISEDVDFCKKAKKLGFKIWVDPSITCDHIGTFKFKV